MQPHWFRYLKKSYKNKIFINLLKKHIKYINFFLLKNKIMETKEKNVSSVLGICRPFTPPTITPQEYEKIRQEREEEAFSPNNLFVGRCGNIRKPIEEK